MIETAVTMANGKAEPGTNDWSLAFLAAMNWLKYRNNERQLLKSEIAEAIELYGPMPTAEKWREYALQNE